MRKKTHEEFLQEVLTRPFIVTGAYKGGGTKITVKCSVCGHEWSAVPNNLLRGSGCPSCSAAAKRKQNKVLEDHGTWVVIDTSTPTFPDRSCKIDKDDFEKIKGRIQASRLEYPATLYNGSYTLIHSIILPGCDEVDHINRDRTDARKRNLRPSTRSLNARNLSTDSRNKSGVTGVYFSTTEKKWVAQIGINRKRITLGTFKNKDDAIKARKAAEEKYFGEFAPKHKIIPENKYEKSLTVADPAGSIPS